jgi:photosystem II stability/assembly factor-like uncharacterized protein
LHIIAFSALISVFAQDDNYWSNAVSGKNKIFSISFIDAQIGTAESADGEILITSDGGKKWIEKTDVSSAGLNSSSKILWQADIYCAIMNTTDGGKIWLPYDQEKQEHFCGVYLKDENTGYNVASDFLYKVTNQITMYSEKNELDLLIDHPQKCTEYYRNEEEGWSLGWCVKNFKK